MSHYMTALAMRQTGLKPATKVVLYWLADHHNGETGDCFPSISRLSKACEMSRRSVQMHIDELERLGLVVVSQRSRGDNGQTSNSYLLTLMEFQGDPHSSKETQRGVQNLHRGGAKSAGEPVQNLPTINLGSNNLGTEHSNSSFDEFYSAYPRKIGKGAARAAWAKAIKKADAALIISKAQRYGVQAHGLDMKFIPHPSTWLNQERWDDEAPMQPNGADAKFRDMVNDLARVR